MIERRPPFEPGATFFLPEILTRLPARCHPKLPEVEEQSAAWVRRELSFAFTSEPRLSRFLETRCAYVACALWPTIRDDWMLDVANMTQHLFVFDDAYGDQSGIGKSPKSAQKVFEDFFAVMEGATLRAGHPYAMVFQDVWASIALPMTPRQRSRYRQAVADWLNACVHEVASRAKGLVFDFDTYLAVRRGSVWQKPCFPITEHGLGIELPEELVTSSELSALHLLCVDTSILINDLYSFPKETMEGDYVNAVPILCLSHGLGLQQAVDRVCELINDIEARFLASCDALLASRFGEDPALRPYLTALGYSAAGLLDWSRFSTRYHGPGYVWNGLTSGVVTLGETGTTICPA